MHKTSIELVLALLVVPLVAQQPGTPPRNQTAFDAMMQQGGIFDIHTIEELDRNRTTNSRSAPRPHSHDWI
jgi:hypothetical protein